MLYTTMATYFTSRLSVVRTEYCIAVSILYSKLELYPCAHSSFNIPSDRDESRDNR